MSAQPYSSRAASIEKRGTSVAASFVAGAAVIVRQYLSAGFYPEGVRQPTALLLKDAFSQRPPAALIKAMLISASSSVGGRSNVNIYSPDPACKKGKEGAAPCPLIITAIRPPLSATPNFIEVHIHIKIDLCDLTSRLTLGKILLFLVLAE